MNGICLTFITLFFKVLRVYYILSSLMKKDLGGYLNNCPLILIILTFLIISNIIIDFLIALRAPKPHTYVVIVQRDSNSSIAEESRHFEEGSVFLILGLVFPYLVIFLVLVFYVAANSRKMKHMHDLQ